MNKSFIALALLLATALQVRAAQHTIGGDTVVNATNGVASSLTQDTAKIAQTSYTTTNAAITFTQSAYWSNNAAALRFNFTDLPLTTTEDRCIITLVGQIGSVFTNVADNITWLGPWGQLNAQTNTITVKWTGGALIAWQDPMHGVTTVAQWVANTDNFNAGVVDELRVSTDAARNLTGIVGRPGGQQLTIENIGSFVITLKNSATSTATNQFLFAQDIALGANQNITLIYDNVSLRWHPIALASVTEPNLLFTDVNTANASTSQHGLALKGDGNTAHFYRGDNTWGTPASGASGLLFTDNSLLQTVNTASEFSIYTNNTAFPNTTFGTNGLVRIRLLGVTTNNSGGAVSFTCKLYLNGTVRSTVAGSPGTSATSGRETDFEWLISEANSTALQYIHSKGTFGGAIVVPTANVADFISVHGFGAVLALDTTATVSMGVTMTFGSAAASVGFDKHSIFAQIIQ